MQYLLIALPLISKLSMTENCLPHFCFESCETNNQLKDTSVFQYPRMVIAPCKIVKK